MMADAAIKVRSLIAYGNVVKVAEMLISIGVIGWLAYLTNETLTNNTALKEYRSLHGALGEKIQAMLAQKFVQ